jgi:hypothetical protein
MLHSLLPLLCMYVHIISCIIMEVGFGCIAYRDSCQCLCARFLAPLHTHIRSVVGENYTTLHREIPERKLVRTYNMLS